MSESVIYKLKPVNPPRGLSLDHQVIWRRFEEAKILCLRKNFDYGSSVFDPPILAPELPALSAIEVRMSDKIKRVQSLKRHKKAAVNESIRDSIKDLGVYSFLWLICDDKQSVKIKRKRKKTKKKTK